jgi:4-diphosphocytidyl-2-C-methyl-D-erythritol kinase
MTSVARVILRPFAKINLTLDVGPRRPDGFHDVTTVMQAISITDRLVMVRRRGPFVLTTSAPDLPCDRTNLIYRAAAALWRAMGRAGEPRDLEVVIEKRIPMAAGLGGGSADAAGTLVGANRLWRGGFGLPDLIAMAATLGSDVPFFLCGGTGLGTGRGDVLYPLADAAPFEVVVVKPDFGVRTADAYGWFDQLAKPVARTGQDTGLELGWPTGPLVLRNSLQGPVSGHHPEIGRIQRALRAAGTVGAAMSGSGSAVFGLFPPGSGTAAAERLQQPGWTVLTGRTLSRRQSGRLMGL